MPNSTFYFDLTLDFDRIEKIRLKNRDGRRKMVDILKYLNIKTKEKTLKISFTSLNIKDKVKS